MEWSAPIDIYCERMGPEFWAEPWNAVSNAAFILAALWAAVEARRQGVVASIVWVLIGLAFAIGVGSFLFHTFATAWSALADVLPIWTFVAVYIFAAATLVGGARPGRVALWALAAVALVVVGVLALPDGDGQGQGTTGPGLFNPGLLNGSEQYAPALVAMLVFCVIATRRGHAIAPWFMGATGMFLLSLSFRTLDVHVCDLFPRGTHFLWHTLNGAMIALLLQALIRHRLTLDLPRP